MKIGSEKMKLSILTATYNRASFLERLYESIIVNLDKELDVEWLIMDDGSEDETSEIVQKFIDESKVEIKYKKQENQGKMVAINNLMQYVTGDLIVDCDSDDYFAPNAFETIKEELGISRTSDILFNLSKTILLVEGVADKACIEKFARKLGYDLSNYHNLKYLKIQYLYCFL